jgi:hypothetical protein
VRTAGLAAEDVANLAAALGLRREQAAPLWRALAEKCRIAGATSPVPGMFDSLDICLRRVRAAAEQTRSREGAHLLDMRSAAAAFQLTDEDVAALPRAVRGQVELADVQRAAHWRHGDAQALQVAREAARRAVAAGTAPPDEQARRRAAIAAALEAAAGFHAACAGEAPMMGFTDVGAPVPLGPVELAFEDWGIAEYLRGNEDEQDEEALIRRAARWVALCHRLRRGRHLFLRALRPPLGGAAPRGHEAAARGGGRDGRAPRTAKKKKKNKKKKKKKKKTKNPPHGLPRPSRDARVPARLSHPRQRHPPRARRRRRGATAR